MWAPADALNSREREPANVATFCFISGLLSLAARPSMAATVLIWGTNCCLSLSRQASKSSIRPTLTSSAVLRHKVSDVRNFWNLEKTNLQVSRNGYLFILAAIAGRSTYASSFRPTRSIALTENSY